MNPPLSLNHFAGWISSGERGLSSEAIVYRLTGVHLGGRDWTGKDHPADPSDFRRCEMLLRQVPLARMVFPAMRDVSPTWARFVDAWEDLVFLAEQECPGVFDGRTSGRSAPLLYARMQELRGLRSSTCGFCGKPTSVWPSKDCEEPQEHTTALYDCDCGDTVTIADAQANPSKHRRCHLIGASE